MNTKSIIASICSLAAFAGLMSSCAEKTEDLGAPSLAIDPSELSFEKAGGTKTVTVTATRDWKATTENEWISVQPKSGSASSQPVTVEISVLENTGLDREDGAVKFDIGFDTKTLTVKQEGTGSASDFIVYSNDFDKEVATSTYGSKKSSWPFLDQFDGWKNASGKGVGSEEYAYSGMSVRTGSSVVSNGSFSDYEGSGANNLFFGSSAYFCIKGIKLSTSELNYTLSFGSEKYSKTEGSTFTPSEFHVYISNDGAKWVELSYAFPNGYKEGRWDKASSTFTLPSGISSLSIYINADVASAYRLDDLSLNISSEAGTAIDFSTGKEIEVGGDDDDDDDDPIDYTTVELKTVADFIKAADKTNYYRLKGVVSGFSSNNCRFNLTDDTGSIKVWEVSNSSDWSSKIKDGGTVELAGKYDIYNTTHEVVSAHIIAFQEGAAASEMSIAEALAAKVGTPVIVTGTVAGTYKKGFVITDGTDYMLVYDGSTCAAELKQKVKVTGTTDSYAGIIQLASPKVELISSDNELNLPEPKALAGSEFDAYSSSKVEYISYEGTLSVSGSYLNVAVEGASAQQGSLTYINDSFGADKLNGVSVKVKGFFVGVSGSSTKYVNTMVTGLEASSSYFNVSSETVSAKSDATSATFDINSNVSWTVASDNAAYTVEPASGEGNGTVTVKFAANATDADIKVNITVATTAEVATKSYTVVLTHKAQGSSAAGGEITLDISGNSSWTAATDKTYGAGYEYSKDGIKYAYYKYESTSDSVAPSTDHIRVYKSAVLSIVPPSGKQITKVVLNCTAKDKCADMTVLTDNNSTAKANTDDKTITWSGTVDTFVAQSANAQVRIKSITVTLK